MITNFQLKPRKCKYHNSSEEFICMNKQCQFRALLCSDCTRENHSNHLHDIRSIQSFIDSFKQKVKFYENQFDKDKVIINVKEIIKSKLNELDQTLNEMFIQIVKMLQKQKQIIKEKLHQVEQKYEQIQNQYKKNLQARYDCLEYLSAYKNSPKALQSRILCSSQWGIVSIKNTLLDIKNLSTNQNRNVNLLTDTIIQQTQKILKEDNFLFGLKRFTNDFIADNPLNRNARITSFIEKSFITTNTHNTITNTPKSSRVIMQRPRTQSMSNMNVQRPVSNQNIESSRKPSLQRIPKIPSQTNLDNNRYIRGLRKLSISKVIIR